MGSIPRRLRRLTKIDFCLNHTPRPLTAGKFIDFFILTLEKIFVYELLMTIHLYLQQE